MKLDMSGMENSPQPTPRSHKGFIFFCVLLMAGTAAGAWWFTRDAAEQEALRTVVEQKLVKAQNGILSTVLDTLLAEPSKSPLPEVRAKVNTTVVPAPARNAATADAAAQPEEADKDAAQKEDTVVRPAFVDEAARWMAGCYVPSKQGGKLRFSVQGSNARFASRTEGLALNGADAYSNRIALLSHVFRPAVLQALYAQYGDSFMEAFDAALRNTGKRKLSDAEVRAAYRMYANYFASLSASLHGIAATPDLKNVLDGMEKASQHAAEVNGHIAEAVFQLDDAREKQDDAGIARAQAQVDALTTQYRQALAERDRVRKEAVATLRKQGGRSLDDATVLFLAEWVNRRLTNNDSALDAANSAAGILGDMASKMQQRQ